ncbi:transposase is4 family protein : Transposase IS4 family protein OS=mine drainage metagenome GN=B2A_02810 PE=4 SV=1: SWIM: DDE_Tnp_1 [Gemmata massiliana]|uniref:SWIM-type domain-containing protein n=1 Tax=Gemmata massiliana TaxID=1210884 RepID=A0A6P2D2H0_9BACT|nr:transposase [Gemmata massiliana]VTR94756.1 transposase is4 family protein : Transposase IS4 family protein OS=mine drainage metagenome GN=B2A_02810 PE=4 SV=1: SWIM: DDE_Tnp_1 [Gemmata massiliana]
MPSQKTSRKYFVRLEKAGNSCTCDDWQLRQKDCKHILAARIVAQREKAEKGPELNDEVPPKKKTYVQKWATYNQSQITEKHRFLELLADLAKGVEELPSNGGRPRTPITDVIFACVYKVCSTVSSRRFGSDLLDAHKNGFLSKKMHPNKINTHLEDPALTPILKRLIEVSSSPLRSVETCFAADSTGFSTNRHIRWFDEKYGAERSKREFVKVHACCGTKTHIVTAVEILDKDANDCPQFQPLVEATAKNFKVEKVTADKAYLSKENLSFVERLGGTAYIPFKSNSVKGEAGSVWERMYLYYNLRRDEFLKHYHARSNVESVFSMIKAKFRDNVRSKTDVAMHNEAYCKFLCHNIFVVIQSCLELGISACFLKENQIAMAC